MNELLLALNALNTMIGQANAVASLIREAHLTGRPLNLAELQAIVNSRNEAIVELEANILKRERGG